MNQFLSAVALKTRKKTKNHSMSWSLPLTCDVMPILLQPVMFLVIAGYTFEHDKICISFIVIGWNGYFGTWNVQTFLKFLKIKTLIFNYLQAKSATKPKKQQHSNNYNQKTTFTVHKVTFKKPTKIPIDMTSIKLWKKNRKQERTIPYFNKNE